MIQPPNGPQGDLLRPDGDLLAGAPTRSAFTTWTLPLINGIAAAAVVGAVVLRLSEAPLPSSVVQEEIVLIAIGTVYGLVAVGIRATRFSAIFPIQAALMACSSVLTVLILGVAGPWLGNDLPPLAVAAFATIIIHFDLGFHARHFRYVFLIAVAGLGSLWAYAAFSLHVSLEELAIWTLVLVGLGLLAYLTRRVVEHNLTMHVDRQASLLQAVSDLGEGLVITESGKFVACNQAYLQLSGFTPQELMALPSMIDLAPPESRAELRERLASRLAGGEAEVRYESELLTKDGRRVQIEASIHRLTAEGPNRLLGLVRDISPRHRAEQAERDTENRFRTLFTQAQVAMSFTGLDGRIVSVNPAYCDMLGYTEEELTGTLIAAITHPDDVQATVDAYSRMISGEAPGFRFEKRLLRKDNQHVWTDVTVRLVRDHDGQPLYFQTVLVNIGDRKRHEVFRSARYAVTQALVTSPGWEKAAPSVLEGLARSLDWDLAEYWEVDVQREVMHFVSSWKRPDRDVTAFETAATTVTHRRGDGLAGRVWESAAPVSMPDLAADVSKLEAITESSTTEGLRGVVGFPVRSGRRVVGMISLYSSAPRQMDDGLIAVMNDIGSQVGEYVERKRAELALQESEKRMRSVLDNVSDGLLTVDQAGTVESANPAVVELFGYSEEELVGQPADSLIATTHRSGFVNYLKHQLDTDQPASGPHETMGKRKTGSLFPLEILVSSTPVGSHHMFVATLRDISERKAHTDALEYQALHDALTGLPNRTLFSDRLRQALLGARRNHQMFGVLLLDLDRFKDVNDSLGHDRGDGLLQEVGIRIRGALRATDTVARLGGDEFAMITTEARNPENVIASARKILGALEAPFMVGDQVVETRGSLGIALYPLHGDEPSTLLRRADVAMYVAKRSGGGHIMYSPEQEAQTLRRSTLAGELRRAVPQGELSLHYQPIAMLATGNVYAVESLVRWNHPREGLLPPDRFISMAEDTGIIHPLTSWVLESSLEQLGLWLAAGLDVAVSVNVSPRCIEDHSLEDIVARALAVSKVDPKRVTLEITEGVAMAAAAGKVLRRLNEMGVRLSLDDFGTGYSSLLYLMRLPLNEIKIDRSFVSGLASDPDSGAIVRSAVGLGHNLGLRVVAEGLQDRQAERVLVEAGCDAAQGFLIGRPVPEPEITAQLTAQVTVAHKLD